MVDLEKLEELRQKLLRAWAETEDHSEAETCREAATTLAHLRAEIERLREALKPFAACRLPKWTDQTYDPPLFFEYGMAEYRKVDITFGDINRAVALIREE